MIFKNKVLGRFTGLCEKVIVGNGDKDVKTNIKWCTEDLK